MHLRSRKHNIAVIQLIVFAPAAGSCAWNGVGVGLWEFSGERFPISSTQCRHGQYVTAAVVSHCPAPASSRLIHLCWPETSSFVRPRVHNNTKRIRRLFWLIINRLIYGASLHERKHSIPISTKIRLMKTLVWPVAMYGCESWTLRKNEETRLDAYKMKGLRKILRVSWTATKTNEWVLNKAGVKRELLDTVKARKLAYYGHTMKKQWSCLEKDIMQGTMPDARRRGRPYARSGWTTSIRGQGTGLSVEESIRMTEDRDKWRKYVHGVANARIEDG